ncbi:MAG TPA: hypothetical protein V6C96_02610, partial [Vampirovibrionales bacterium]
MFKEQKAEGRLAKLKYKPFGKAENKAGFISNVNGAWVCAAVQSLRVLSTEASFSLNSYFSASSKLVNDLKIISKPEYANYIDE